MTFKPGDTVQLLNTPGVIDDLRYFNMQWPDYGVVKAIHPALAYTYMVTWHLPGGVTRDLMAKYCVMRLSPMSLAKEDS